jgi:enamine deaminase RidA (YjgF/YER057c/UK114 family)
MASTPETRIQELHLTLPPAPVPVAKYKPAVKVGNLLYVSGHGPLRNDKTNITGKVGKDLNLEEGKAAARQVGLAILSTVKNTLGSLDNVVRLVKTLALVNCTDDFGDQPKVVNGFSELMAEVYGEENGVGARSALGTNSLPGNISVEIECIFEIK